MGVRTPIRNWWLKAVSPILFERNFEFINWYENGHLRKLVMFLVEVLSTLWRTEMIVFFYIYLYGSGSVNTSLPESFWLLISLSLTRNYPVFLSPNPCYATEHGRHSAGSLERARASCSLRWWPHTLKLLIGWPHRCIWFTPVASGINGTFFISPVKFPRYQRLILHKSSQRVKFKDLGSQ